MEHQNQPDPVRLGVINPRLDLSHRGILVNILHPNIVLIERIFAVKTNINTAVSTVVFLNLATLFLEVMGHAA